MTLLVFAICNQVVFLQDCAIFITLQVYEIDLLICSHWCHHLYSAYQKIWKNPVKRLFFFSWRLVSDKRQGKPLCLSVFSLKSRSPVVSSVYGIGYPGGRLAVLNRMMKHPRDSWCMEAATPPRTAGAKQWMVWRESCKWTSGRRQDGKQDGV